MFGGGACPCVRAPAACSTAALVLRQRRGHRRPRSRRRKRSRPQSRGPHGRRAPGDRRAPRRSHRRRGRRSRRRSAAHRRFRRRRRPRSPLGRRAPSGSRASTRRSASRETASTDGAAAPRRVPPIPRVASADTRASVHPSAPTEIRATTIATACRASARPWPPAIRSDMPAFAWMRRSPVATERSPSPSFPTATRPRAFGSGSKPLRSIRRRMRSMFSSSLVDTASEVSRSTCCSTATRSSWTAPPTV